MDMLLDVNELINFWHDLKLKNKRNTKINLHLCKCININTYIFSLKLLKLIVVKIDK